MRLEFTYVVERRVGNKTVRETREQSLTIPHDATAIELDLSQRRGPAPDCEVSVKLPEQLAFSLKLPEKPEA